MEKTLSNIQFAAGLPPPMRAAAQQLIDCQARESIWSLKERDGLRKLLEAEALVPMWQHLANSGIDERDDWGSIIIEHFLLPYAQPDWIEFRSMEADHNIDAYSSVSEAAFRLVEALDAVQDGFPGYRAEVAELTEGAELRLTLARLLSLTTTCEWPRMDAEWRSSGDSGEVDSVSVGELRDLETKAVYREFRGSGSNLQDDGSGSWDIRERGGRRYRRVCDVFRDRACDDIFIGRNDEIPPLFQPVDASSTNPELYVPVSRAKAHAYIRQVKSKLESLDDSLSLTPKHCAALQQALFSSTGGEWQINNILSNR